METKGLFHVGINSILEPIHVGGNGSSLASLDRLITDDKIDLKKLRSKNFLECQHIEISDVDEINESIGKMGKLNSQMCKLITVTTNNMLGFSKEHIEKLNNNNVGWYGFDSNITDDVAENDTLRDLTYSRYVDGLEAWRAAQTLKSIIIYNKNKNEVKK